MSRLRVLRSAAAFALTLTGAIALSPGVSGAAQPPVNLRTAAQFAVLAGEGITNANATTIVGDVGTFPNPAQTGFDTVTLTGTNHHDDAVSQHAKDDLGAAYDQAVAAGPPTPVAVELGGTTVKPGVYNGATLEITGTLTLDTEGNPHAVFIFQSGSSLTTASDSSVVVLNGGTACNVFWAVPSSADLGTDSHLIGTVLASTAIVARSGATIEGRLLAQTASVTLDHNTITATACAATTGPEDTGTTTEPSDDTTDVVSAPSAAETQGPSASTATPASPAETIVPAAAVAPPTTPTPPAAPVPTTPRRPSVPADSSRSGAPPLAATGVEADLTLAGTVLLAAGLALVRLSTVRRRYQPAHAASRRRA